MLPGKSPSEACSRGILQATRLFEAEHLPVKEIEEVWKDLSDEERQALVTFNQDELYKQAVKRTRLDIEGALCASSAYSFSHM